jgi:hypothetical protein
MEYMVDHLEVSSEKVRIIDLEEEPMFKMIAQHRG